ncbi:hypothetical protein BN871_DQ_00140 [Paenibacillus sp. P22]|nr:hypothetical protein BN871_DQ_00140 [Paenibacillus sp. P22]
MYECSCSVLLSRLYETLPASAREASTSASAALRNSLSASLFTLMPAWMIIMSVSSLSWPDAVPSGQSWPCLSTRIPLPLWLHSACSLVLLRLLPLRYAVHSQAGRQPGFLGRDADRDQHDRNIAVLLHAEYVGDAALVVAPDRVRVIAAGAGCKHELHRYKAAVHQNHLAESLGRNRSEQASVVGHHLVLHFLRQEASLNRSAHDFIGIIESFHVGENGNDSRRSVDLRSIVRRDLGQSRFRLLAFNDEESPRLQVDGRWSQGRFRQNLGHFLAADFDGRIVYPHRAAFGNDFFVVVRFCRYSHDLSLPCLIFCIFISIHPSSSRKPGSLSKPCFILKKSGCTGITGTAQRRFHLLHLVAELLQHPDKLKPLLLAETGLQLFHEAVLLFLVGAQTAVALFRQLNERQTIVALASGTGDESFRFQLLDMAGDRGGIDRDRLLQLRLADLTAGQLEEQLEPIRADAGAALEPGRDMLVEMKEQTQQIFGSAIRNGKNLLSSFDGSMVDGSMIQRPESDCNHSAYSRLSRLPKSVILIGRRTSILPLREGIHWRRHHL